MHMDAPDCLHLLCISDLLPSSLTLCLCIISSLSETVIYATICLPEYMGKNKNHTDLSIQLKEKDEKVGTSGDLCPFVAYK